VISYHTIGNEFEQRTALHKNKIPGCFCPDRMGVIDTLNKFVWQVRLCTASGAFSVVDLLKGQVTAIAFTALLSNL
jgi:hypothetical protein